MLPTGYWNESTCVVVAFDGFEAVGLDDAGFSEAADEAGLDDSG